MRRPLILIAGLLASTPSLAQERAAARPSISMLRYEEDWRGLCDPAARIRPLDELKCIGIAPDTTLTLGGELRERLELVRAPDFGLEQKRDAVLLHRAMLHADLRVGDSVRAFAQFGTFGYTGRVAERGPFDLNRLDLVQGFLEVTGPVAGGAAALRGGRQEISLGSARLVGTREGPNVRRAFDGVRASWTGGQTRVDAFYLRPVTIRPGVFDDATDRGEAFWGVYATSAVAGPLNADLYLLGQERDEARFAVGTGPERRRTIGARLFGEAGGWDWDWEGAYQFGRFGASNIGAWTIATDTGFTFRGVPYEPRLGLKADIASGDRDPRDRRLGTFNALYPKLPYFSEANLIAPANIVDVHPSLALDLGSGFKVDLGWNALWRYTERDAIYGTPLSAISATAGRPGRFIGHQAILGFEWQLSPNAVLAGQYVHFWRGDALRRAGGRDTDFLMTSIAYKF